MPSNNITFCGMETKWVAFLNDPISSQLVVAKESPRQNPLQLLHLDYWCIFYKESRIRSLYVSPSPVT